MDNKFCYIDLVHNKIIPSQLCISFINVPEFQRLRRVKQLGVSIVSFPNASHTRFEHCLGVMKLAGDMVDQLCKYVSITNREKQLIELAGLYHDIGHLAYSHLFDNFLSQMDDNELISIFKLKHHEERSAYFLKKVNSRLKLLTCEEEDFVINVIKGRCGDSEKKYLFQIVNNKNGIDVDRMDYLIRDSKRLGLPEINIDFIIMSALLDSDNNISFEHVPNLLDTFLSNRAFMFSIYNFKDTNKIGKIYYCCFKRLGCKLFQYGEETDDYNIETLLRNDPSTKKLMDNLDHFKIDHNCDLCCNYKYLE